MDIGERVQITEGSGLASRRIGTVISRRDIRYQQTSGGIIPDLPGHYKSLEPDEEIIRLDDGEIISMYPERLHRV